MKLLTRSFALLVSTGFVFLAFSVYAHDAWVEPGAGPVYKVLYGHKMPESYKANKITSLKVFDARQKSLRYSRQVTTEGVSIDKLSGVPAMFALEFDNGYWVKVGAESKNIRYSQMPSGTDPSHPLKFSKTILSWQPWMAKPLGQRIEFIPIAADQVPRAGSQLRLKLLLDGKPLAGQMVENNSDEKGPKTDVEGNVTVMVVSGVNRFATDHDIQQKNDPDAKRLSLTAAFVFVAK